MKKCNHSVRLKLASLLLLVMFSAAACDLAPDYERPAAPVPAGFPDYPEFKGVGEESARRTEAAAVEPAPKTEQESSGSASEGAGEGAVKATDEFPASMNMPWNEFFTDQTMRALIFAALENNRDLRLALLNIERARAMYQIQRADLLPGISASGQSGNQGLPAEIARTAEPVVQRQHSAQVGITSYELDLFGRVRNMKEAALQSYFAQAHNAHNARISLVAEVAAAYLTLVSYKELYDLTEDTYKSRRESYGMTQNMFNQGVASQLVLNQSRTLVEEARVNAAQYRTYVLQYENALSLLIGGPLPLDLAIPGRLADVPRLRSVPAGLPSEILERRPDILAAEHSLIGANANIGAARASFFPRISLTGGIGYMSADLDSLFKGAAKAWSFVPQISVPVFEGGRLLANLRVSEVQKEMAVASYEKAIQAAFREVADALALRSTITEQVNAITALRDASRQSYELSRVRYDVGLDSFMNVLDSQRSYFSAQQSYVAAVLTREINSLNLYKALGGGWE